jgi:hypothetical protein
MLAHGVFSDLDHRLNGLDILTVPKLLLCFLEVFKHFIHVSLVLVQVVKQLIGEVIVPISLFLLLLLFAL